MLLQANKSRLLKVVLPAIGFFVFASAVSAAWSVPSDAPPNGNVPAPLHVNTQFGGDVTGTYDNLKVVSSSMGLLGVLNTSANASAFAGSVKVGVGGYFEIIGPNSGVLLRISPSGTDSFNNSAYLSVNDRAYFGYDGGPRQAAVISTRTYDKNIVFDTNNIERMRITAGNGYIGIWETDPNVKLVVGSGTGDGNIIGINGADDKYTGLRLDVANGEQWFIGMNDTASNNDLVFKGSTTPSVLISKTNGSLNVFRGIPAINFNINYLATNPGAINVGNINLAGSAVRAMAFSGGSGAKAIDAYAFGSSTAVKGYSINGWAGDFSGGKGLYASQICLGPNINNNVCQTSWPTNATPTLAQVIDKDPDASNIKKDVKVGLNFYANSGEISGGWLHAVGAGFNSMASRLVVGITQSQEKGSDFNVNSKGATLYARNTTIDTTTQSVDQQSTAVFARSTYGHAAAFSNEDTADDQSTVVAQHFGANNTASAIYATNDSANGWSGYFKGGKGVYANQISVGSDAKAASTFYSYNSKAYTFGNEDNSTAVLGKSDNGRAGSFKTGGLQQSALYSENSNLANYSSAIFARNDSTDAGATSIFGYSDGNATAIRGYSNGGWSGYFTGGQGLYTNKICLGPNANTAVCNTSWPSGSGSGSYATPTLAQVINQNPDASTVAKDVNVGLNLYVNNGEISGKWLHATAAGNNSIAGNLGIGTTNPPGLLSIGSDATDGNGSAAKGLIFAATPNGNTATPWAHAAIYSVGSSGYNGDLVLATDGDNTKNSNATEKMRIGSTGRVGIGTSDLTENFKLTVGSGAGSGNNISIDGASGNYVGTQIAVAGTEKWFSGKNNAENFVVRADGSKDVLTAQSTPFSGAKLNGGLTINGNILLKGAVTSGNNPNWLIGNFDNGLTSIGDIFWIKNMNKPAEAPFVINQDNIVSVPKINISSGAGVGKILTSDTDGNGSWQSASAAFTPGLADVLTKNSDASGYSGSVNIGQDVAGKTANLFVNGGQVTGKWIWATSNNPAEYSFIGHSLKVGGKVGIGFTNPLGTPEPTENLDIAGTSADGEGARIVNTFIGEWPADSNFAAFTYAGLKNTPTSYALMQGNDGQTYLNSALNQPIHFRSNNEDKMAMSPSGNFGIGTGATLPAYKLQIKSDTNGLNRLMFQSPNAGTGNYADFSITNDALDDGLTRIGLTGQSFSGTGAFTADTSFLDANSAISGGLSISSRANVGTAGIRFYTGGAAATNQRMSINNVGNIVIGDSLTSYKLNVGFSQASENGIYVKNSNTGNYAATAVRVDNSSGNGGAIVAYSSAHPNLIWQDRVGLVSNVAGKGVNIGAFSPTGDIKFLTGGSAVTNERMSISSAGMVSIGGPSSGSGDALVVGDGSGEGDIIGIKGASDQYVGTKIVTLSMERWFSGRNNVGDFVIRADGSSANPKDALTIKNDGIVKLSYTADTGNPSGMKLCSAYTNCNASNEGAIIYCMGTISAEFRGCRRYLSGSSYNNFEWVKLSP